MQFTQEQIVKLAPDTASVKAGQKLANNAKWETKHQHEKALWGSCKGSGKNPYKTMVDLKNLAFKCSCPSRKFPCKHSLGLLFLFANNSSVFTQETELAEHVEEWIGKREVRAEKKETQEAKPVDAKAQQKRAEARTKKVEGGLEELRLWLKDTIRTGILHVPNDVYGFSKNITARMVDAQAGGLANQLKAITNINFYTEGWQKQLIKRLANIYLITEAYQHKDQLPEALLHEVKSLIGWNTNKEEILALDGIQDHWLILSRTIEEEERLQTERIWVYGKNSQQFGLLLNFYAFNQLPQNSFIEGTTLEAELVAYPASFQQRMLVKSQKTISPHFELEVTPKTVESIFQSVSEAFAISPFIKQIPVLIGDCKLIKQNTVWYLKDSNNQAIKLTNSEEECWTTIAITKGHPFSCFGIYINDSLNIHAIWQNNQYQSLK